MAIYDTIAHWHAQGMPRREIARRLGRDRKTVRRAVAKIEAGIPEPKRTAPPSKLAPFYDRIAEMVQAGRTAANIYSTLSTHEKFDASYTIVKRYVATLHAAHRKVYERLEHVPGAELQIDFGELTSVSHDGQKMRTWALVGVYPASRYRFSVVVLHQTVPAFLAAIQKGIRSCGVIPKQITLDNLASGVLRDGMKLRYYQRDFAAFCAHYGMIPNAVRPRTPTDKGMVENAVGALKIALRGEAFSSLSELESAVSEKTRLINARVHASTHRIPLEVFEQEPKLTLPDPYPIAIWSEHRVRSDCHIQLLNNYYSAPHKLVGEKVTVRRDESSVTIFHAFSEVARHDLRHGKGYTQTNRAHYPPHKQPTILERRQARLLEIRSAGPSVAAFLHGLENSPEIVVSDHIRALSKLLKERDRNLLNQACTRAVHFGNYSVNALTKILDERLFELPLDNLDVRQTSPPAIEIVRSLSAYAELFGGVHA